MADELVKVKKPELPVKWDYDDSVKEVKTGIYKWKNITIELATELWVAREFTNGQGKRTDIQLLDNSLEVKTWTQYCLDIGSQKDVVNRWLKQWFPDNVLATLHTGDPESYTPEDYVESVRIVLGGIDLDPAKGG